MENMNSEGKMNEVILATRYITGDKTLTEEELNIAIKVVAEDAISRVSKDYEHLNHDLDEAYQTACYAISKRNLDEMHERYSRITAMITDEDKADMKNIIKKNIKYTIAVLPDPKETYGFSYSIFPVVRDGYDRDAIKHFKNKYGDKLNDQEINIIAFYGHVYIKKLEKYVPKSLNADSDFCSDLNWIKMYAPNRDNDDLVIFSYIMDASSKVADLCEQYLSKEKIAERLDKYNDCYPIG